MMNRALIGKARTGKTTIANYTVVKKGGTTAAFADPIRAGILVMFGSLGLTPEHFEDDDLKEAVVPEIGLSPRQLMQRLGTEFGRNLVHPDIWIKVLKARNAEAIKANSLVVTDVRLPNEYQELKDMGFGMLHVQRPDAKQVSAHSSEQGVAIQADDSVIVNDSSLESLFSKIDLWLAVDQPS